MAKEFIDLTTARRLAGLELNALLYSKALPADVFQNANVSKDATSIHDISGDVLFYRFSMVSGKGSIGYVDIAANSVFCQPLLGISYGAKWDEKDWIKQAVLKVGKSKFNKTRIVAYSYPKLAVQFLLDDQEIVMLELATWEPVPLKRTRKKGVPPSNFERWSLVEETSQELQKSNLTKFKKRVAQWDDLCPPAPPISLLKKPLPLGKKFMPEVLNPGEFARMMNNPSIAFKSKILHYSTETASHFPCYEVRGQITSVWCAAASVQMILDFYRYNYPLERVARELGLGTLTNPIGLDYRRDGAITTVLQDLTSNALTVNMNSNPNWDEYENEIDANRPLISYISGHVRTVAGYLFMNFLPFSLRLLVVYDPCPPATGSIHLENFDTQIYRRTFTTQVTLI